MLKRFRSAHIIAIALLLGMITTAALAKPARASSLSRASEGSVFASAMFGSAIIHGASDIAEAGGKFVVASVTLVGESAIVVVESVATGARFSLEVVGEVGKSALTFAGKSIEVVLVATGRILVASGEVIAYIARHGYDGSYYSSHHHSR